MGQPKSSHGFRLSSLALKYLLRKNKTKTTFCSNMLLKKTEYKKAQARQFGWLATHGPSLELGVSFYTIPLPIFFPTCAATSKVDSPCQHRTLQNLVSLTILVTRTSERKSVYWNSKFWYLEAERRGKKPFTDLHFWKKSLEIWNDFWPPRAFPQQKPWMLPCLRKGIRKGRGLRFPPGLRGSGKRVTFDVKQWWKIGIEKNRRYNWCCKMTFPSKSGPLFGGTFVKFLQVLIHPPEVKLEAKNDPRRTWRASTSEVLKEVFEKEEWKQWVLVRVYFYESNNNNNNNNNNLGLACVFLPFSYQCPPTFRFFSVRSEASVHGGAVERIVIQVTSRFTALRGWILAQKNPKKNPRKFENIQFHRQNMSKWTNQKNHLQSVGTGGAILCPTHWFHDSTP